MNLKKSYFIDHNKYFFWCDMKVITCRVSRVHVHNNVPATCDCAWVPVPVPLYHVHQAGEVIFTPCHGQNEPSLHDRVKMYVL